jgi:hypothetical protein
MSSPRPLPVACTASLGLWLSLLLGLPLAGCAPSDDEPELGELAQPIRECPEDTCGSNSPRVETFSFHELSTAGRANAQGMRISSATLGRALVKLRVDHGYLYADTKNGLIGGAGLIGLVINVAVPLDNTVRTYALELRGFRDLPYPVPAGAKDYTGAYVFEYVDWRGVRLNLCNGGGGSQDLPYDEAFGQKAGEAVFYEGDRVDTESMTIGTALEPTWFNIGCAGHTLAKLHLTRNSTASGAATFGHQHADRQATLKMFVADYCGTGKPFTVAGQPLAWRDPQRVMEFYGIPTTLEARWSASGATCLGEPRMINPATPEGALKFPDIYSAIKQECPDLLKYQRCTIPDIYNFDGQARVTANRQF